MLRELSGSGGRAVGTAEHLREVNGGTFFAASSVGNEHYEKVIGECARRCSAIAGRIRDDLERYRGVLFAMRRENRERLQAITYPLARMCSKARLSSGSCGRIREMLQASARQTRRGDEIGAAYDRINRASGFNGAALGSSSYISKIDDEVMGRNCRAASSAGENRYWEPIKNDLERIAKRLRDDVVRGYGHDDYYIKPESRRRLKEYRSWLQRAHGGGLRVFEDGDVAKYKYTSEVPPEAIAEMEEYQAKGVRLIFRTSNAGVPCSQCAALDGQIHTKGVFDEMDAVPPLHPNCRCRLDEV